MGGASVELQDDGKSVPVHVVMYRFDKNDKLRAALKDTLLYYNDFGREGEVKLGDKTYKVMLHDLAGTGDYSKVAEGNAPGVRFLIDANGNGEFERRGEAYPTGKPFNIAGTTYEIKNIAPSGASLDIVKSTQTVEEILPPPDLSVGKPILAFQAKTTDDKTVNFPSSYKGKLVMLDFWATWCGPCKAELPNLTAAYKKYHEKGFDVLSVSLDRENWAEKLAAFTKEHDMPWPQIYDGKYWSAEIAQKFGVDSIPRAFLVDGTTGKIVAEGNSLRGEALDATISKALANRS
jgi:thiol-disulfide isomerase/thioredoxin